MVVRVDDNCPCESGATYGACCERYVEGDEVASSAEKLMRSRYSAYVLGHEAYLLRTWHKSTRPENLSLADHRGTKWLGLKILRVEVGRRGEGNGVVEFVARYKVGGKAARLHEVSRFVQEDGEWLYVDGDVAE